MSAPMHSFTGVIFVLACAIALASAQLCEPFKNYEPVQTNTCSGSNITYAPNGESLDITASVSGCSPTSYNVTANLFFDPFYELEVSLYTTFYYLEYEIMWGDAASQACIVDFTLKPSQAGHSSIDMKDLDGVKNSPFEDMSRFELNVFHKRTFLLDSSLIQAFRFGFTCGWVNPQNATDLKFNVRSISWRPSPYDGVIYDGRQTCIRCTGTTIEGSVCLNTPNGWSWVYPQNLRTDLLETYPPLVINGSLYINSIHIGESLTVANGCLYPIYDYISIWIPRAKQISINLDPACKEPNFSFSTDIWRRFDGVSYDNTSANSDCDSWSFDSSMVQISRLENGAITFFAPLEAFTPLCGYYNDYFVMVIVLITVLPTLAVVGIIIGIVFGVRKYRQKKALRQMQLELHSESQ